MTDFIITNAKFKDLVATQGHKEIFSNTELCILSNDKVLSSIIDNVNYYLVGYLFGRRNEDGNLIPVNELSQIHDILIDFNLINELEGRFVIIKYHNNNLLEVVTDNFGRLDVFYQRQSDLFMISSNMDAFKFINCNYELNYLGVTHALNVYGSRPAKKDTLYKDIKRLGFREIINLKNGVIDVTERDYSLLFTEKYCDSDLDKYADIFIESVRSRASESGNIVYLSSGWDSTSILAVLIHLFGNNNTRCVIGRMQYSDRSGVINQFELDRAKLIADYYGVKLDVVELDYRNNAQYIFERAKEFFKRNGFANMTSFNHFLLAEAVSKIAKGDEVIFAGEMSDGAHNLGFSQYTTVFHPDSFDFREYSDKMLSYLHGPTFYEVLKEGRQNSDPIWNYFRDKNSNIIFDTPSDNHDELNIQILSNFFLRSGRLPFYSIKNSKLISPEYAKNYLKLSEDKYLRKYSLNLNKGNLYSSYLDLYNSFHWQGSTVSTLEYTADHFGFKCALPFIDYKLIEFLSAMPEHWGRGLDLNPTKYPLKWLLKNRIDYPIHLQTGPHSYLYDVQNNFSLLGEIINASSFKPLLLGALNNSKFVNSSLDEFLNKHYIDDLISKYSSDIELEGSELNDLSVIAFQSLIDVY